MLHLHMNKQALFTDLPLRRTQPEHRGGAMSWCAAAEHQATSASFCKHLMPLTCRYETSRLTIFLAMTAAAQRRWLLGMRSSVRQMIDSRSHCGL